MRPDDEMLKKACIAAEQYSALFGPDIPSRQNGDDLSQKAAFLSFEAWEVGAFCYSENEP